MRITNRDKLLLNLLQTYGCLTTHQIGSKLFPGVALTTVLRRLRLLAKDGLIQKVLGLETSERLWALTKMAVEKFEFECAKTNFPRAILEHDTTLSTLRMRLEDSGIIQSWAPEHAVRKRVAVKHGLSGMKRRVIPDGIMGVRVGHVNESVALELELTNKNQERYREILWGYAKKESPFAVWYVVKSKTIQQQIEEAKKSVYFDEKSPKLLFSFLDDVLKNPLTAQIKNGDETNSVQDLFEAEVAHPDAHLVSGNESELDRCESELTTCNDGTRSDPHALISVPLPPLATHPQHAVVGAGSQCLQRNLKT